MSGPIFNVCFSFYDLHTRQFYSKEKARHSFLQPPLSVILSNKFTCLIALFLQLEAVFEEKKVPGMLPSCLHDLLL